MSLIFGLAISALAADADSLPQRGTPAIWRIHNGASTIFLFGSLHILPPSFQWMTPEIDAAMRAADQFVFEVPVDEEALKAEKDFIIHNGILPHRQTLRSMLSSNEFQIYAATLRRAGLKSEQFTRYRPWLASIMLGLAYLHSDDLAKLRGADDDIMSYAREHGKSLIYLESIREQMELLTSGNESMQLKAFKSLIISLYRSRPQEQELRDSWAAGDDQRLTALIEGYFRGRPEAKDWLVGRRNRIWLATFKNFMGKGGTTMITVGAAHIGGNGGLIALLCNEGYEVERVGGSGGSARVCEPGA
jgi:hypothetical protein